MNILVVNDDGPNAFGLQVLRDAVKKQWRRTKVVTVVPKTEASGAGFSLKTCDVFKMKPHKVSPGFYTVPAATPVDIVNLAFGRTDLFLPEGQTFDLLLSGVNHVANTGWGILNSGTVAAAMQAAFHYGACGWAFAQAFGPCGDRSVKAPKTEADVKKAFANTIRHLPGFFSNQKAMPGECWNVNFPYHTHPKGWIQCLTAPFDPYMGERFTPASMRQFQHDVGCLDEGFVTRSPIALSYNPPMNW